MRPPVPGRYREGGRRSRGRSRGVTKAAFGPSPLTMSRAVTECTRYGTLRLTGGSCTGGVTVSRLIPVSRHRCATVDLL